MKNNEFNKDELYHLIDLLEIDTYKLKNNDSSKRLLSQSMKDDNISFNRNLIQKLMLLVKKENR